MWSKWDSHTGGGNFQRSDPFEKLLDIYLSYSPALLTPGRNDDIYPQKYLCKEIHSNIIYNGHKLKATQMSISRRWKDQAEHVHAVERSSAVQRAKPQIPVNQA